MNIFFIPSWYPSETDPLPGIFFKEQAHALVKHYPNIKIGISTWGQNDERLLLWGKQVFKSLSKVLARKRPEQTVYDFFEGRLLEYFTPKFTWSSKVLNGNIKQIIEANMTNFDSFQRSSGKIDIIHAHVGYPAGHIARKISEVYKIPYVITEQMSPFPHQYFGLRNGALIHDLKSAYDHSERNIAISASLAEKMEQQYVQNVTIIPNLVDECFFSPGVNISQNQKFTFFSLGRMVPQKGIDILLKAFAALPDDALLRVGGDGEFLKFYKQLAVELKINQKISWLGALRKEEVLKEMQKCDAFVLPSRHESMGVVFAEAMACGKPVIGTICGGPEEFIDESSGILISPENVEELTKAMKQMIEQYSTYNAGEIRQTFETRFSSKVVAKQIMDVYLSVLQSFERKL